MIKYEYKWLNNYLAGEGRLTLFNNWNSLYISDLEGKS